MNKYEEAIQAKEKIEIMQKEIENSHIFYNQNGKFQFDPYHLSKDTKIYIKNELTNNNRLNQVIINELLKCLDEKLNLYINRAKQEAKEILNYLENKGGL